MTNYHSHYTMAFDLTYSGGFYSGGFLGVCSYSNLTNFTISLEMTFDAPLADNVESHFMGERASTVYVRSKKKISKDTPIK